MDMQHFLQALRWRLSFRVSQEELNQVMADYNEYFDSGVQEGRSEAELCARFGDPRTIADEVTAPNRGKLVLPQRLPTLVMLGILFIAINFFDSQVSDILCYGVDVFDRIFWLFLLLSLLSMLSCAAGIGQNVSPHSVRWCVRLTVAVVLAVLGQAWFMQQIPDALYIWAPNWGMPLEQVGPLLYFFFRILLFFATGLWYFWVVRARFLRPWMLAMFPVYAAISNLVLRSIYLLNTMEVPSVMLKAVQIDQQSALWQLALILLVPLLLWLRRRKEQPWTHR